MLAAPPEPISPPQPPEFPRQPSRQFEPANLSEVVTAPNSMAVLEKEFEEYWPKVENKVLLERDPALKAEKTFYTEFSEYIDRLFAEQENAGESSMVLLMCDLDNSTAVPGGAGEIEFMRGDLRFRRTLPLLRPGFVLALQEKRQRYGDRLKFSLLPSHEQSFLDEHASKFIPAEIIDGYMPALALSSQRAPVEVQPDLYGGILGENFVQELKDHSEWQGEVFADGRLENYRRIVAQEEPAIQKAISDWREKVGGASLSVGYVDDLPTAGLLLNNRGYWVREHGQSTFGVPSEVAWTPPRKNLRILGGMALGDASELQNTDAGAEPSNHPAGDGGDEHRDPER